MNKALITVSSSLVLAFAMPTMLTAQEQPAQEQPATQPPTNVEPIDFRKMKEAMPEKLGDIKRTENKGQKTKLGDIVFTQTTAVYGVEGDQENPPSARIEVLDYSNTDMMKTMTAWSTIEIDEETDTSYSKSVKVEDQPGVEEFNTESKHGSLQLLIGGRLLLTLNVDNVTKEQFQAMIKQLPVKALAAIAK